jgi:copper chaperone NosL
MAVLMVACTSKPEAIRYGLDSCDFCRMTIMEPQFGGEIVTRKGKVYKFDAAECLVNYYKKHLEEAKNYTTILVSDYSVHGKMLDAKEAVFIQDGEIESPMGAHMAAFPNMKTARQFSKGHRPITDWDHLVKTIR